MYCLRFALMARQGEFYLVIGHHLIWTVYGYWLPNDPRGSSSHTIRVARIAELGEIHFGRKHIQPSSKELREFKQAASAVLKHEVLTFDAEEIIQVGRCLGQSIREHGYTCYACAVMPDHVHLLIRKHRDWAENMIEFFQSESRAKLIEAKRRPWSHPVWGGPGWKVFQETRQDMERTVKYVEKNPLGIGLPQQTWEFVTRYNGWVPGYRG
jgi:REP element-mobilizing transposase RayT